MDNHPASWCCIRSLPKHEHIAALHLDRLPGVRAFNPRITVVRPTRRGPVRRTEPLFPNYIFAQIAQPDALGSIRRTPGVKAVLQFGSHVPTVPDRIIQDLKQKLGGSAAPEPMGAPIVGQDVEVVTGPLRGTHGHVARVLPSKQRVEILLDLLGSSVTAELNLEALLFKPAPVAGAAAIGHAV